MGTILKSVPANQAQHILGLGSHCLNFFHLYFTYGPLGRGASSSFLTYVVFQCYLFYVLFYRTGALEYYTMSNNTEGLKKCYMALEDNEALSKLYSGSPRLPKVNLSLNSSPKM